MANEVSCYYIFEYFETATSQFIARKLRMPLNRIDFDIHAERNEWGSMHLPVDEEPDVASRLHRIWGVARVHTTASQADVDELARLVKIRCPLASMVILSGCKLEVEWVKADTE